MASIRAATAATAAEVQYLLCTSSDSDFHGCQAAYGHSKPKVLQGYELQWQLQIWEYLSLVIFPAIVMAWLWYQSIGAITKLLQNIRMFARLRSSVPAYPLIFIAPVHHSIVHQYASPSFCYLCFSILQCSRVRHTPFTSSLHAYPIL